MPKNQHKSSSTGNWIWTVIILLFVFLISVFVFSNIFKVAPKQGPEIGIPSSEINLRFRIFAPEGLNSFRTGDDIIRAVIDNTSNGQIAFENDFGARIFTYVDGEWIELKNFMQYPGRSFIVSPSQGDPLKMLENEVSPILPEPSKTIDLRIYFIGNIYTDNQITDEKTAAFVDVRLHP